MSSSNSAPDFPLPRWIFGWLLGSSLVVLWDALFVLCRPDSMPGGALHFLWRPYALYIQIDHRYGDLQDPFVRAQSWMNLIEIGIALAACALARKRRPAALLLGYTVSVMTLAKTVLYFVVDAAGGFAATRHNELGRLLLFYLGTNGVWLVVPAAAVYTLGRRLKQLVDDRPTTVSETSRSIPV